MRPSSYCGDFEKLFVVLEMVAENVDSITAIQPCALLRQSRETASGTQDFLEFCKGLHRKSVLLRPD